MVGFIGILSVMIYVETIMIEQVVSYLSIVDLE